MEFIRCVKIKLVIVLLVHSQVSKRCLFSVWLLFYLLVIICRWIDKFYEVVLLDKVFFDCFFFIFDAWLTLWVLSQQIFSNKLQLLAWCIALLPLLNLLIIECLADPLTCIVRHTTFFWEILRLIWSDIIWLVTTLMQWSVSFLFSNYCLASFFVSVRSDIWRLHVSWRHYDWLIVC